MLDCAAVVYMSAIIGVCGQNPVRILTSQLPHLQETLAGISPPGISLPTTVEFSPPSTVKSHEIHHLRQSYNLWILSQKVLRRISVFLTRYSLSYLAVLDLINWLSQFG